MEDVHFNFEDLRVYEMVIEFVDVVYKLTDSFPKEEKYRLTAQFNRYLQIAQDSIKECVVCSTIARRQNFIKLEDDKSIRVALSQMAKMITNLQKYLKK
jgi:hypothetical protein